MVNAGLEVSKGFRSGSLRTQSARVLSGLNPVDTNGSAFNYCRSARLTNPMTSLPIGNKAETLSNMCCRDTEQGNVIFNVTCTVTLPTTCACTYIHVHTEFRITCQVRM